MMIAIQDTLAKYKLIVKSKLWLFDYSTLLWLITIAVTAGLKRW